MRDSKPASPRWNLQTFAPVLATVPLAVALLYGLASTVDRESVAREINVAGRERMVIFSLLDEIHPIGNEALRESDWREEPSRTMALLRANASSLRRGGAVQVDAPGTFSVGPARSPEIARALEALLASLERLDRAIAGPHPAGPYQAQAIRAASDTAVEATDAVVAEMEGHFAHVQARKKALLLAVLGLALAIAAGLSWSARRTWRQLPERTRAVEVVFEHSLGCVVLLDRNFNFIRVNHAYARACGREVSAFPGRNHFDLYPSDARAIFENAVRTKQPFQATAHPFVFPDHPEWGETYWDWTLVPVVDASGEVELLLFSLNDMTERVRAEKNLRAAKQRLRALSHRLLELQEAERGHLARELHDQLGQSITAIKLNLEAALRFPNGPGLDTHLSEAVSLLERLLSDVRGLSLQLRPALLEDLGLDAAIRSFAEAQAGRAGLAFRFKPLGAPNRLESDLETACFRVAQEAVTNVLRHARAMSLEVALRLQGEQLHLVVRDDGTGFDPDEVHQRAGRSPGFGLSSMEERAFLAGGQLTIHSRPGAGTEVHAVFPASPAGPRKRPGEGPEQ